MIKRWPIFIVVFALLFAATGAFADGMPYVEKDATALQPQEITDGIIRLTPDRTRILQLNQDAASVIVTNPEHAIIVLDSSRRLVIMPRLPGTTAFTVLDSHGQIIMQKSIVVTAVQKKYVRIHRICGKDANCVDNAYYYCPDGCYEVTPVKPDPNAKAPPAPIANRTSSADFGSAESGSDSNNSAEDFEHQPVQVEVRPGLVPQ